MTDVKQAVEAAQEKGTFSVLAAAKGIAYPKEEVTVFQDVKSAYEIGILERTLDNLTNADKEKTERIEEQIGGLKKNVVDSRLTFHLTALSPGVVEDIQTEGWGMFPKDEDANEATFHINMSYIAASVQKVVDGEDNEDKHVWTGEEIAELKKTLPDESFEKISAKVMELSFVGAYFDQAVDADFLSKS